MSADAMLVAVAQVSKQSSTRLSCGAMYTEHNMLDH
jgi:hypothetical protein